MNNASNNVSIRYVPFSVISLLVLALAADLSGQDFVLEVPGDPSTRSQVTVARNELIIVDATGKRFRYAPPPEHNSPGGDYLGFYCVEVSRYLRWPASGTGSMQVGTPEGNRIQWRKSLMEIRPAANVNRRIPLPDPRAPVDRGDPFGPGAVGGRRADRLRAVRADQSNVVAIPVQDSMLAAHVDEAGILQVYLGRNGQWKNRGLEFRDRLPPGAELAIAADSTRDLPRIFFVSNEGQISEVDAQNRVRTLPAGRNVRFPPGSPLASAQRGDQVTLAAVDTRGRLLGIDPDAATVDEIERHPDLFMPGAHVKAISVDGGIGVFLIDRRGNLVNYEGRLGRWARPQRIAGNLVSGGYLDAGPMESNGIKSPAVIAIDNRGRVHAWEDVGGVWEEDGPGDVHLAPGAPVSLATFRNNLSITSVEPDGDWCVWHRRSGLWARQVVANGFHPGSSVLLHITGPYAFAVDPVGRLVAARYWQNDWECSLCLPTVNLGPRLVRRAIVPNEPLPPVTVEFSNNHTEELVVRLIGGAAGAPIELTIRPGTSVAQGLERDAGSTLEEIYLAPGPGGELVEEVHQRLLPPKQIYSAVVYANRVTSVYFDRTKNESNVPDESGTSLVSLGVFPIAGGDYVRDGDRIDVYREATFQRNPGAAALFDRR